MEISRISENFFKALDVTNVCGEWKNCTFCGKVKGKNSK
jgi:hypothetical protein